MRAINILRLASCLFAANVSAEDGLERCVGKICVSAKENLMQFKAKWSADIAPSKTRTPDSYPVLCLWDQKRHLSYQFEFIGTHGGSGPMDAPVGKTQLGEITISQSDFCKSAQNKKGNIAESFMSQMLGKNISEVMLKKGKPYRIDEINDVQRSQSNVNSPVEKIAKQYVYLLNPEATLLINSYYTNSSGKIVRTSISERP
jgi:hypothetical protein